MFLRRIVAGSALARRQHFSRGLLDVAARRPKIAKSDVAILLIDFQRAFLDGQWARGYGLEEVQPIVTAAANTAEAFDRGWLDSVPAIYTRCYLDPPDAEPPDILDAALQPLPWVWKPSANVMEAEGFSDWIEAQMAGGVRTLVVGGCTTTSCVRVSSQAVQQVYAAGGLQVVVDLSLCGARAQNGDPRLALLDETLVELYGEEEVAGRSAVELAVLQMSRAGVQVVPRHEWEE